MVEVKAPDLRVDHGSCPVRLQRAAMRPISQAMTPTPALPLLDIRTIRLEPGMEEHARDQEILARFPKAERILVASHWRVPAMRDADARGWLRAKQVTLMPGVKRAASPSVTTDAAPTSSRPAPATAAPWLAPTAMSPGARATATR